MKDYVVRIVCGDSRVTAIEYGLIAALIALAVISAARLLGT